MSTVPFEIDDTDSILIYGVRYSMGFFAGIGMGSPGSIFEIVSRTPEGVITLRQIFDYVPTRRPDA
jgi:hypothetical protein